MTSDLSITPATLTVAANDATKTYGDSDPTLTYGLSGFVNGEDATSAQVSGAPDLARGGGEKVGGYAISVQDTGSLSAPNYAFQASATPADFTITPAPLTISANNQSKAFGKTLTLTGTEFTTSPAKLYASGDSVTSVTLTCSTNSGGTSGTAANAALGTYTLTPSAAVGTGISNYRISYASGTLTVAPAPTTITLTASPTQCGETSTFTASVSPATAGGQTLTGTVQFAVNGAKVGSPVAIDAGGVATCSYTANLAAGSYPVTATFAAGTTAADSNFANPTSPASTNLAVSQKNATIAYSGDTLGVAGSALNLQATAMDSSAAGYGGANPQSNTKPGDITKMWIAFVITPVGGATSSTVYAPVLDTGVAGDGIGTASATFKATSQSSYNVVASLVAGSGGGTNLYYSALDAQPASLTFYTGSGQFATGGGWLKDPTTGTRGNFGLLAGYTPVGKPMGLFSYCWCGTYNGVPAFFTISASNITALGFSGAKYPLSATLSGTATLTVTKATNCGLLYGPETNLPISVTACDTGQSSGVGVDKLSLTLTGSKAPFLAGGMKSFTGLVLGGGNVVIHLR